MLSEQEQILLDSLIAKVDPIYLIQAACANLGWLIGMSEEETVSGLVIGLEDYFEQTVQPGVLDTMDLLEYQPDSLDTEELN